MKPVALFIIILTFSLGAVAHVGGHPSIHNTVADIIERMKNELSTEELGALNPDFVWAFLTEEEQHILSTEYLSFEVDVPVTVMVVFSERQAERPKWLETEGFTSHELSVTVRDRKHEIYQKDFDAGRIGLGYSGLTDSSTPYFVLLATQQESVTATITHMYPGRHTTTQASVGAYVYSDGLDYRIAELPEALEGLTLIRGLRDRRSDTQLLNLFRITEFPSSAKPDHVVLTWAGDPRTTQSIQWRNHWNTPRGVVEYGKKDGDDLHTVEADSVVMRDAYLVNDPDVNRFTVALENLAPGTTYRYRVGNQEEDGWTDWAEFNTAPAEVESFKFIYMGDAQNGLDTWGELLKGAYAQEPDAAFFVMAGDLVNRGIQRDDWDRFFHNASGIFDRRQLVPAIGNHEDQGSDGPWMYLANFDLPKDGPENITPERAYALTYSNALFVVLDSNLEPALQSEWLEAQLANTEAKWKFVVYHHPAYSSAPRRDNLAVREHWLPLFDKYRVDLALQGHDHAYLRTYPLRGGEIQDSPNEGTIYIVSVAGTKFYEQGDFETTEFGMTNVSTFQVLDITIGPDTLEYKAYDHEGKIRDSFVINKP